MLGGGAMKAKYFTLNACSAHEIKVGLTSELARTDTFEFVALAYLITTVVWTTT